MSFHKTNYVPDHAIIGVSGDITLAEARTKFEAALKGWAKSGSRCPASSTRPITARRRSRSSIAGSVQTAFMLGELAIDRKHPDYDQWS